MTAKSVIACSCWSANSITVVNISAMNKPMRIDPQAARRQSWRASRNNPPPTSTISTALPAKFARSDALM